MAQTIWEQDLDGNYVAPFDKDAELVIPVNINKRLADIGFDYASHTVEVDDGLVDVDSTEEANGVIFVRVKCAADVEVGSLQKVNVRFVTSDGQQDDIPLYLRITD